MILDFIATIAWPLVVIVLGVTFRKQLGSFLGDITELAFPGGSLKTRRGDAEARELKNEVKNLTAADEVKAVDDAAVVVQKDATVHAGAATAQGEAHEPTVTTKSPPRTVGELRNHINHVRASAILLSHTRRTSTLEPPVQVLTAATELQNAVSTRAGCEARTFKDAIQVVYRVSKRRIGWTDSMKNAYFELIRFAQRVEDGAIEVSNAGALDYLTSVIHWLEEYADKLEADLEAEIKRSDQNDE